ncbi:MAG: hypothetical protein K2K04_04625 [Clostridia bacterium]|nr:hypothetical protein [Clostridia bacterium]
MGEEKHNKIVAAVTVNAILLIFIILAVLIAQIVQISVLKRRKAELFAELAALSETYEKSEDMWADLEGHGKAYELAIKLKQLGATQEQILRVLLGDDYDKYDTPVLAVVLD